MSDRLGLLVDQRHFDAAPGHETSGRKKDLSNIMRKRFSDIKNASLFTSDDHGLNAIGKVVDLLVESDGWTVRYLVVSTTAPLSRRVLIAPAAIRGCHFESDSISTSLTSQQVINSPLLKEDQPVSRQYEQALVDYYGWPIYWFGRTVMNTRAMEAISSNHATKDVDETNETSLRSALEICGYRIQSQNGPAGIMKDLVIGIDSWTIELATAEPRSWVPTDSSMFPTSSISKVDWSQQQVWVDLRQAEVLPAADNQPHPSIIQKPWRAPTFPAT